MKIAILGADGLLGQACRRTMPGDVVALGHAAADLTRPIELRQRLTALAPAFVINCAGYTQVDRAEADVDAAFAVNAAGVRDLSVICRDLDCTLVHVSTNYVFGEDNTRAIAYDEDERPGPVNVYGRSKLAGEQYVRDTCARHFVLRTCGLYGPGSGASFVSAMLRKAALGEPIRVVDDQVGTPTTTTDLARAIAELLTSSEYGLYHVTNAGACSWHEFARAIFEFAGITVPLIGVKSDEYATAARRPRYAVLSNERWIRQGFTALAPWQAALRSYLT